MADHPPEFIDYLASVLYTQRGIDMGANWVRSRWLDPDKLQFPWVMSSSNAGDFEVFRPWYNPIIFIDSVFIPVLDVTDPAGKRLAGFDVRYVGTSDRRTRYQKFKRSPMTELIYNSQSIYTQRTAVVTEGAVDAEVFLQAGYNAISILTAMSSPRWAATLYGMFDRIMFAYDNNQKGIDAIAKMYGAIGKVAGDVPKAFQTLTYKGNDPNDGIRAVGLSSWWTLVRPQLEDFRTVNQPLTAT